MKVKRLHGWQLSVTQALELQHRLAAQVSGSSQVTAPHLIAGVDIATGKRQGMATGAVVVLSYPEFRVMETKVVQGRLDFPYIPGLLSFRELPLTLAACESLSITPDLVLVDGQGVAHPRRFGIASHLGLFLDRPTIGCAKSRLCGRHEEPEIEAGSYAELVDRGETIGVALRTRRGVKPVYVSTGHQVDLETAIHWVTECCRGYRLPEPLRLAHQAAGGNLGREKGIIIGEVGLPRALYD
ncbi:MAG: deoxyribonuclease V [Chloroflexi bacterium]|nr:deoxyribonuclease V [Chloroflexota bacterium]MBI3930496.1 deoxyribonuclease V [Chloroflexota bacterium]